MSDLIKRDDVFKALGITDKSTKYGGDHSGYNTLMLYEIMDAIDSIPTAEPKMGRNVKEEWNSLFECSVCGWECGDTYMCDTATFNYCPNCGAKMERSE